ncbi:MAG: selenide, water dikinase SelD [Pseudomonadales bacterium]
MFEQDLVLVGGGHTHVLVIKALAMRAIPGVRVTLISEQVQTPYSGMLPGFVAGHYAKQDTLIDLNRLCQATGVRWIKGRVTSLDLKSNCIEIDDQASMSFDLVSIDVGSNPGVSNIETNHRVMGVKPIASFHRQWQKLQCSLAEPDKLNTRKQQLGVVGAGVGGVELCLALAHRLRSSSKHSLNLLFPHKRILPGLPASAVSIAEKQLRTMSVQLHSEFKLASVDNSHALASNGQAVELDHIFLCTDATAPKWPGRSGLECDTAGFIRVNRYLQSVSHSNVFAAGDVASIDNYPRPKAGVFAVRQAPFLVQNFRHYFSGGTMQKVKLQSEFLRLITLGDQRAIACRNGLAISGPLVWRWKDRIDRKFMSQFSDLRSSSMQGPTMKNEMKADNSAGVMPMHCAGCGSKLGPQRLQHNLASLPTNSQQKLRAAVQSIEDAVVWEPRADYDSVQSIDGFRSFTSNHYIFARITVNHALNDLYAMGARPLHVQAWANLAFAHPSLQQRDHLRLMLGVNDALVENEAVLAGGHSSEGMEDHLGLVVNGEVPRGSSWSKAGAQEGDVLLLSKALGTGVILAANTEAEAPAEAIAAAMSSMLSTNRQVWQQLQTLEPSAVTDVSGFGLAGHLLEMLTDMNLMAELSIDAIPVLEGAEQLAAQGFRSSLYAELEYLLQDCTPAAFFERPRVQLLLDPQTSGGLLFTLSAQQAAKLCKQSDELTVIGHICRREQGDARIRFIRDSQEAVSEANKP